MENSLSGLQQKILHSAQCRHTDAAYLTISFRISCIQYYASSKLVPKSTLLANRSSLQNGTIVSTAERWPTYEQPLNNPNTWTVRCSSMSVLTHFASGFWIGIVSNSSVDMLLYTSSIDRSINEIFFPKWKIKPWHSHPVAIVVSPKPSKSSNPNRSFQHAYLWNS